MFSYFWEVSKNIKSILLVDDDSDDHLLFKDALEAADRNVSCMTAVNGNDALQKLESLQGNFPDIIIMDVNMPVMNGIECLRELTASHILKAIPVIMYSTSCSRECENDCIASGAVAYMEKPSDYSLLIAQIKHILTTGVPATIKKPMLL